MSFYSNNFLNPLGGGYSPVGTQGVTYAGRGILDGYEPIEFSEQCNDVYVQESTYLLLEKAQHLHQLLKCTLTLEKISNPMALLI